MKLNLITEDKDVLLIEEMLNNGVINEGILEKIDDALVVGTKWIGAFTGPGDIVDIIGLMKSLMQKKYLDAALYFISLEPTPASDIIAQILMAIQRAAKYTDQEKKLNKMIGWLLKKTNNAPKNMVINLFTKVNSMFDKAQEKTGSTKESEDTQVKKSAGIMGKVFEYAEQNLDKMKDALIQFLDLVEKKAEKLDPVGGVDAPDEYFEHLASQIYNQYHEFLNTDTSMALAYKNKVKDNAMKGDPYSKKLRLVYEKIFGPIPELE